MGDQIHYGQDSTIIFGLSGSILIADQHNQSPHQSSSGWTAFEYGTLLSPLNNVHKASSDLCDVIVLKCMIHPMVENGI